MTQPEKDLIIEKFAHLDTKLNLIVDSINQKLCKHDAEVEDLKKMRWKITGFAVSFSSIISIIVSALTIYITIKKLG